MPVRRVLDIGCGHGGVLADVRERLGVEVVGIDLRPPRDTKLPIIEADAVRDPLPQADVAYSICLAHHLSEAEVAAMILNVGRSCRRFIVVDLVRHWLPLGLFHTFVAPFFSAVAVADGSLSVRRAYTEDELKRIAASTGTRFRHSCAPFRTSQTVDIDY